MVRFSVFFFVFFNIGVAQGRRVSLSKKANVFAGWDSCFEYPPTGKTYAEMEKSEKNAISHRGKALEKLKEWLAGHVQEFPPM